MFKTLSVPEFGKYMCVCVYIYYIYYIIYNIIYYVLYYILYIKYFFINPFPCSRGIHLYATSTVPGPLMKMDLKCRQQPGRKQAWKHVRDAHDFNNIETRAVIKSSPPLSLSARQSAEGSSRHSDRNISLFPSWSGQGLISTPVHQCN